MLTSAKDQALLAGRKLLLADDSATIQKVVDLTFTDEGFEVVTVGNGKEAIERLEEIAPDVVLADVFMPEKGGYEVCEYIKGNKKFSRIPVMLLVGSFEPFDEAEARRVGADDILTKPFQSIRSLIDRVAGLVSRKPNTSEIPTTEFPTVADELEESQTLKTGDLEINTADTQPLPQVLPSDSFAAKQEQARTIPDIVHHYTTEAAPGDNGDLLLDLGDFEPTRQAADEEYVLDLDFDDFGRGSETLVSESYETHVEPAISEPIVPVEEVQFEEPESLAVVEEQEVAAEVLELAHEMMQEQPEIEMQPEVIPVPIPAGQITLEQLSPEVIDAIAKRVVEQLSEKVIQEIAWEVVPSLSELLIKQQLRENESSTP